MNKYMKMLELDKIISKVVNECVLDKSKENFDNISLMNDLNEISNTLDQVDEAVILTQRLGRIPLYFTNDVGYSLKKIHKNGILSENELLLIENFFASINANINYSIKVDNAKIIATIHQNKVKELFYSKEVHKKINDIITPYGEIKDDASSALKDIRRKIKDLEKNIQNKLQEILNRNSDKLNQTTISLRNDRYVIPVKNEYKNNIKGIIHDQSASGETVFIEPTIICEMNNNLNQTKELEKREIFNILRNISSIINTYYDELIYTYNSLINLDIIFAKAKYAIDINANKPNINKNGIVELWNCRHPLLNVEKIVSNNIIIGKTYKGIIITGPNTGGKTVLLKTVGLLSLMIKMGLLIPCDSSSNIMIFDKVFSDIGDEQSINQNLSTFSSHLTNVITILKNVTKDSLVLLDELGSGTDPVEGASLAISIFDHLLKMGCLVISTSHYSELKLHAYDSDNIINASVEFDLKTLKPTYKLLIGVPGMSNALNIAKNLGLNDEILKSAQNYVYKKNDNLNNMLDKLIKQSHELEKKLNIVEENKKILDEKIRFSEEEKNRILNEKSAIINDANQKAKKLINDSMAKVNDLLLELKEMKDKNIKLHELANLKHQANELKNIYISENVIPENIELKIGMSVYVKNYQTHGKIVKLLKNGKVEVAIGNAIVKVDESYLSYFEENQNEKIKLTPSNKNIVLKQGVSPKLDLRGKRYEEAEDMIDKYLDDALYNNLHIVTIIHGFGTGTIRKLVHNKLDNNKNVDSYRYGGQNEGGQGATIVVFKE